VKGRLERGRAGLEARLVRRGLTLPAALATLEATRGQLTAGLSCLVDRVTDIAVAFSNGQTAALPGVSAEAARLAQFALKGNTMLKMALLIAIPLGLAALGSSGLMHSAPAQKTGQREHIVAAPRQEKPQDPGPPLDAFGDSLPADALLRLGTERFRTGGLVYACAYSPDGKIMAVASGDQSVHLFDALTGKPIRHLRGERRMEAYCVAFSHNGRVLASGSYGSIMLWDPADGTLLQTIDTPHEIVWSLAFTPDDKRLVSGGQDKSLRLWQISTGEELLKIDGHKGPVRSVAVSPDGQFAVSGSMDTTVRLWDLATGQAVREFTGRKPPERLPDFNVQPVAFSPDGKWIASKDEKSRISLWETATGKVVCRLPHKDRDIYSLAFSPDGKTVAAGTQGHQLLLWDVPSGQLRQQRSVKRGTAFRGWHWGGIPCLCFSSDGKTVGFAEDSRVAHWDIGKGQEADLADVAAASMRRIFFSKDGKTLVSASDDPKQQMAEWDFGTGRVLRRLQGDIPWADQFDLSADHKVMASSRDQHLRFWDTATGKEIRQVKLPLQTRFISLQTVTYSPDGKLLAGGGNLDDGSIRVWEAANGSEVCKLEGHGKQVFSVAFAPDSKTLASCGQDKVIRIHDLATGKELRQWPGQPVDLNYFGRLIFSPDGKILATLGATRKSSWGNGPSNEKSIRLWEVASGKLLVQLDLSSDFSGSNWTSPCPVFSPDGRTLASGGSDATVQLWEIVTGKERRAFHGHRGPIEALAFSHDGKTLASGSDDTTVLIWSIAGKDRAAGAPREPDELEERWRALAEDDAARAYAAIRDLAAAPNESVSWIKERIKPAVPIDPKQIEDMVGQLDDEDFNVRQKASLGLLRVGERAVPALDKALAGTPTLETSRRLQDLRKRVSGLILKAERLQAYRAVEVLERIGTPQARELLQVLAQGAPGALVTAQARGALGRLGH
jgi:WD40 repeat protein